MTEPSAPSYFDLSTPRGRRRAWRHLYWIDHGFLRVRFRNFHWISPEMARANQPSPAHVRVYAAMGIKTIVNLRGFNDSGHYHLEREACERVGIKLINFGVKSRDAPTKEVVRGAKALFESLDYPALMHCKSGADRAGLMSVLYKHFRQGAPIEEAMEQLSLKYLHVRQGKTGVIDFFFQSYLDYARAKPITFLDWVEQVYDPAETKARFQSAWWANVLVDRVLRRE